MTSKKNIYVITGGPGFGKTELVEELRQHGFTAGPEYARQLIEEGLKSGGDLVPWKQPKAFQQEVLHLRSEFFNAVADNTVAFCDRGIPDQVAFARAKGFRESALLIEAVQNHRYANTVFITPPWKEIYTNDFVRKESYEEACRLHAFVLEIYGESGYTMVELPFEDVKRRALFIQRYIADKQKG